MAQLKSTTVTGNLSVTGEIFKNGQPLATTETATPNSDGLMSAEDKKKLMYHINDDSVDPTYLDIGIDDWSAGVHMTQSNDSNVVDIYGDEVTVNGKEIATTDELARKFGFITFSNNPNTLLQDLRTAMGTDIAMVSLTGFQTGYYFVRFAYYGGYTYNVIASNLAELYRYSFVGNITTMTFMDLFSSANKQSFQPEDGDLTAIAELTGISGFLKKTGENTWELVEGGATGNSISTITKTSSDGLVDTYTITYTNGTTTTFTVTNGADGEQGEQGLSTLVYTDIFVASAAPAVNQAPPLNRTKLNRTPVIGDYFTTTWRDSTTSKYYNVLWVVNQVPTSEVQSFASIVWAYQTSGENATTTEVATTDSDGLMSSADKTRLDSIKDLSQMSSIDTWMDVPSDLDIDPTSGVTWVEPASIYDSTGTELWFGNIAHRLPITPGHGIEFEPDLDGNTVQINATGGSGGSDIIDIPDQYVRIWGLETGIYRLTYSGTKYIYYSGATSNSTQSTNTEKPIIYVNKYINNNIEYRQWFTITANSALYPKIFCGYTDSSAGFTLNKNVSTLLTNISAYVKNDLTYSTSNTTYALSAYQGYRLDQNKQNKTDNTLATTNKTIVGAINELNGKVGSGGSGGTASIIIDDLTSL